MKNPPPGQQSGTPPAPWPVRPDDAHKGTFGRCLLIGGSRGMAGSISLSALAALRVGAGLVSAAVPDRCLETVAAFHPALMTVPLADDGDGCFAMAAAARVASLAKELEVDCVGIGPGMRTGPGSIAVVERLWMQTVGGELCARVFDADAINVLAESDLLDRRVGVVANGRSGSPIVLTPHPGELQRLVGVSSKDRGAQIDAAQKLAAKLEVVIVVKGGPTIVVDGDRTWTNTTGNPGMATAGSGDVLTGVLTGLLGQQLSGEPSLSIWDRVRFGVWLHGRAGDLATERFGQASTTAVEICDMLSGAFPR